MSDAAYHYKHEHLCQDDVVRIFVSVSGFAGDWVKQGNYPGIRTAEDELNDIAEMFDVDRHDPDTARLHNFPVRLEDVPEEPTFCSGCLQWFK